MNFKVYWSGRSQFAKLHRCHKKTFLLWKTQNSEKHAVYICIPRVFAYVIRYTLKFSVYLIAYLLWVSFT